MDKTPIHSIFEIHSILEAVCKQFNVSLKQLRSTSHRFDLVLARACYAKIATSVGFTLGFVGKFIGKSKAMVAIYLKRHKSYLSVAEYRLNYNCLQHYGETKF